MSKKSIPISNLPIPQRKKQKGMSGKPIIYNEPKRPRSLSLTDTAIASADRFAAAFGLSSRSEAIEIMARIISVIDVESISQAIQDHFDSQPPADAS